MTAEASVQQPEEQQPEEPRLSVVMVFGYNPTALGHCLKRLGAGPECKLELIVVDNGSGENLDWLLDEAQYGQINLLRLPRDFGLTKALNVGLKSVNPDTNFVLTLNPAIELDSEDVQKLAGTLLEREDAVAVAPLLLSPEAKPVPQIAPLPTPAEATRYWQPEDFWQVPERRDEQLLPVQAARWDALMIRFGFLRAARFLDERFGQYWADVDLAFQIFRAGKKILLATQIQATHKDPGFEYGYPESYRPLLLADAAGGMARLIGKHFGAAAGLRVRLWLLVRALARLPLAAARLKAVGEAFSFFGLLLSGQKIDGYHGYR